MNKIISFPTKEVRDKATIERAIRKLLPSKGASQAMIDTIIQNMSEFLDILCTDIECSVSTNDPHTVDKIKAFQISLNERNNRLIIERLNTEITRYNSLGSK